MGVFYDNYISDFLNNLKNNHVTFENNDSLENYRNLNFTVFNHQVTKEYDIKASQDQTYIIHVWSMSMVGY